MEGMKLYYQILDEIEMIEFRIEEIQAQLRLIERQLGGPQELKAIDYSRGPRSSYEPKPLEDALVEYLELKALLDYERQRLQEKERLKKKIEEKLEKVGDLEAQIAYKKEVENKKLLEIADELGYSYQYIRERHARYKRTYNQRTDRAEKRC